MSAIPPRRLALGVAALCLAAQSAGDALAAPEPTTVDIAAHIAAKPPGAIRIALLHMDARPGEVAHNRRLIERAVERAAAARADWLATPELAESGYGFAKRIGLEWIEAFPSAWLQKLAQRARHHRIALFIGLPEKNLAGHMLHNSVAVIDRQGKILGTHRKYQVVGGAIERWATPGVRNAPFALDGVSVGVLVCADAYRPELAGHLRALGAQILISPANWPPVPGMGPEGYWEARTAETGVPLIVNNRTGNEPDLDFSLGESVVAQDGKRLFSFTFPETRLIFLDWDGARGFTAAGDMPLPTQWPIPEPSAQTTAIARPEAQ